jgi:hypothetical protein
MTHPSTGPAPIIRLDRDEHRVAIAQHRAAPSPPRIAVKGRAPGDF